MIWFLRRCTGWVLCAVVLLLTGCLEGFEQLVTSVRYDPFEQAFHVERRLVNIGERFLIVGKVWTALLACAASCRARLAEKWPTPRRRSFEIDCWTPVRRTWPSRRR